MAKRSSKVKTKKQTSKTGVRALDTIGDYRQEAHSYWQTLWRPLHRSEPGRSPESFWKTFVELFATTADDVFKAGCQGPPNGDQFIFNSLLLAEMWPEYTKRAYMLQEWPKKPGVYGGKAGKSAMEVAAALATEVWASLAWHGYPFDEMSHLRVRPLCKELKTWLKTAMTSLAEIKRPDLEVTLEGMKAELLRANEPRLAPTKLELEILSISEERECLTTNSELEYILGQRNMTRDRKTVGEAVRHLMKLGLLHRPVNAEGKPGRKGSQITEAGKRCLVPS